MLENVKKQVESAGLSYEDYVAIQGKSEEELENERKAEATKNLKAMLVVEQIIFAEHLEVTKEVLEEEYKAIAAQYSMDLEAVKNALKANEAQFVNQLRNKIFTEYMLANNAAKVEENVEKDKTAKKTTQKATKKEEVAE